MPLLPTELSTRGTAERVLVFIICRKKDGQIRSPSLRTRIRNLLPSLSIPTTQALRLELHAGRTRREWLKKAYSVEELGKGECP